MQIQTHNITPEWLYNTLMYDIEPELITDVLPLVAESYADETDEEKEERRLRYVEAFKELHKRLQKFSEQARKDMKAFKDNLMAQYKDFIGEAEVKKITDIESSIEHS